MVLWGQRWLSLLLFLSYPLVNSLVLASIGGKMPCSCSPGIFSSCTHSSSSEDAPPSSWSSVGQMLFVGFWGYHHICQFCLLPPQSSVTWFPHGRVSQRLADPSQQMLEGEHLRVGVLCTSTSLLGPSSRSPATFKLEGIHEAENKAGHKHPIMGLQRGLQSRAVEFQIEVKSLAVIYPLKFSRTVLISCHVIIFNKYDSLNN